MAELALVILRPLFESGFIAISVAETWIFSIMRRPLRGSHNTITPILTPMHPTVPSHLVLRLLRTTEQTSSSGSNETGLLTLSRVSGDRRSLADMLMVTTTVRMVHRVHGNTTSLGPRVALDSELMLSTRCLQHRLVCSSTTCNNTDHTTSRAENDFLRTAGELDSSLALVRVVSNHSDIVARSSSQSASVTSLFLHVRNHSSFGDLAQRKDVSDGQGRVLASIDELSGEHPFVRNEKFGLVLVLVWRAEGDLGQGRTTTWVVDDLLDYATNIAMLFRVVELPKLGSTLSQSGVSG